MYYDCFQIKDYPENFLQCSVEEQKVLAIFEVDTGPYASVYLNSLATEKKLEQ